MAYIESTVVNLVERVPTRIPGLDIVLNGGLLKSGVYVIVGEPGTGKTILGNQLCFNHVKNGHKAVYITLLAEAHDRMLAYLQSMSFFDAEVIPDDLHYISGYQVLEDEGLQGLMAVVRKVLRSRRASLLVLDGFILTREIKESELASKKMIHELQAFAALVGCTIVLLTIQDRGARRPHPGYTMVDGVIELSDRLVGPRAVRELQVKKIRGTGFLRGKHTFDITNQGTVVYPRTEVLLATPKLVSGKNRTRKRFGIPEFDKMLNGGVLSSSMTTLLGAPGTGKTLLGLSFLVEGARQGEKGIYFGFYEPPEPLIEKAGNVGIPLQKYCDSEMIEVVWQPPLEHLLDALAERLMRSIHASGAKRVFIDGIEGFKSATVYPERIGAFLAAITNELRSMGVTAIFSDETDVFKEDIEMPVKELAAVIENVIVLRFVELRSQLYRLVSILKARESSYDPSIRQFFIKDDGLVVADSFQSAESILSGRARVINGNQKSPDPSTEPSSSKLKSKPRKVSRLKKKPKQKNRIKKNRPKP